MQSHSSGWHVDALPTGGYRWYAYYGPYTDSGLEVIYRIAKQQAQDALARLQEAQVVEIS